MVFKSFEEMPVWREARELTRDIYSMTQSGKFIKDYGLRDQIQRSSVSIMSNIAEGYERTSHKDFMLFLAYARGSVGEVRSQLYIALDLQYIDQTQFRRLYDHCVSISKQLTSFLKYLKSHPA